MITMFSLFFIRESLAFSVSVPSTVENEEKHTSKYFLMHKREKILSVSFWRLVFVCLLNVLLPFLL